MDNPAQELYRLFGQWRVALDGNVNSTAQARGLDEAGGLEAQRRAMAVLLQTIERLDDLEDAGVPVAVYRRYIPAWTKMLMGYPLGWYSQTNQDEAFPPAAMDQLETLSSWFRVLQPKLRPESEKTLQSIVADTDDLLRADESISVELKRYLARLLREIQAALDDEKLGTSFDYAAATERLWVALFAAAAQSKSDEQRSKWSDLGKRFWMPTTVGLITSLPGAAATIVGAAIAQ